MLRTLVGGAALILVATTAWAADGAAVFKSKCASCHGATGQADSAVAKSMKVPAIAGNADIAKMSDADIAAKVKGGAKHAGVVKGLTDDDLTAVAKHVKELAGK